MKNYVFLLILFLLFVISGCDQFLDAKPRKGLVVPEKLEQLLSLLRKENESMQDPRFGELSTDDYYWNTADLNSKDEVTQNCYSWKAKDMFGQTAVTDWALHYRFIYYANTVLEKLADITPVGSELAEWNLAKGEALFYRGKFLYDIAIIWASAYNIPDNDKILGVPLRLNTNFNERSYCSTLKDSYIRIVKDIEESISFLPEVAEHATRPSKTAARAMLARIYLSMGEYEKALARAEEVLNVKSDLLDYKTISVTADYSFAAFNKEVIFHCHFLLGMTDIFLNPILSDSYLDDDLRKSLYFVYQNNGKVNFKGSYYGRSTLFSGLAVDEMYLIAAECHARSTSVNKARDYMTTLMAHRYKKDKAPILTGLSKEEILDFILNERRKELVFRGVRWGDVKRLNNEGRNIQLERYTEGASVYLLPNDPRFNLPFPEGLLDLSDIVQNER